MFYGYIISSSPLYKLPGTGKVLVKEACILIAVPACFQYNKENYFTFIQGENTMKKNGKYIIFAVIIVLLLITAGFLSTL